MKNLLLYCLLLFCFSAKAQDLVQNDRAVIKIKSIFIYNFTQYIDWPDDYKKGSFVIGILEDKNNIAVSTAFYQELCSMAKVRKAGTQPFEILLFKNPSEINKCHLLYVPTGASELMASAIKRIDNENLKTLIVTDKEGLSRKGSAINFVRRENRQKFELNESNATKYNLKVATKFKNLAIVVN